MLGFLGMSDIEVIAVEGTLLGEDVAEKALNAALARASAGMAFAA